MTKSLVLLSGGQDSTTCLYWAKQKFDSVEAVSFDYGQKHILELQKAEVIAIKSDTPWKVLHCPKMYGSSPLTDSNEKVGNYDSVEDLPEGIEPTFVPARNILFITMAVNYALSRGIKDVVTGVCQVDYGGYPDCRADFIASMNMTLNLGIYGEHYRYEPLGKDQITIHTPLMYLTKKETVLLAKDLNCIEALGDTHTCYEGTNPPCGKCHSCLLRARGFEEAGIEDPLMKGEK